MKAFLSAGDILINPDRIAYAVIETDTDGQQVRLGFDGSGDHGAGELRLDGFEARSVIRWLRRNAEFLDSGMSPVRSESSSSSSSAHAPFAARSASRLGVYNEVCAEA